MFRKSPIIAVYLCYYDFMLSQTDLQFKSDTSLNARISNIITLLLMYKAHVGRCLQIKKRRNRGREKMSEYVGTDGAKIDPTGIQSVPYLIRFVAYHGGRPGSTWDLWWMTVTRGRDFL
jgi:hypothetical protein